MRTKDENKRIAIRDATVTEVVEGGLPGASIGRIAERAGVSQGTIYLYYDNKDVLIRQVYVEIKLQIRDALMAQHDPDASSADNLKNVWFAYLDHSLSYTEHFMFAEAIAAAKLTMQWDEPELARAERQIKGIITRAIDDGTLRDAPYEAVQSVLISPVTQLSRRAALSGKRLPRKTREATFDLIWQGIANS